MRRSAVAAITVLTACLVLISCSHRAAYLRPGTVGGPSPPEGVRPGSRIVLVGDAGEIDPSTLGALANWTGRLPELTVTLFLGDNMYPEGMTSRRTNEADQRLGPQIRAAIGSGAGTILIPGNHDWDDGGDEGYDAVLAQANYVSRVGGSDSAFLPAAGCPGPVAIDRYPGMRIIVLDTQWWLHDEAKPSADCSYPDTAAVITAFARLLETERHVVVAAHHPLFGYGRHAGFSDWRDHLWPPVVGSLIALSRKLPLRTQDYNSTAYRRMVDAFRTAMDLRPQPGALRLWAAGHEHSLQILEGDDADTLDFVLISGSAAKTNPVNHGDDTVFAQSSPGFMVLDVFDDRSALVRVVGADGEESFQYWLYR